MATASSMRAYSGPVFFERGFRPFFFAAGAWAAMALPVWLWLFASDADLPAYVTGRDWHLHEMLYGYLAAAKNKINLKPGFCSPEIHRKI